MMKIQRQNGTLTVQDVQELSAANARSFCNEICAAPLAGLKHVEIDLSQIRFLDGYGLGALAALYADLNGQNGRESVVIRLFHPQPPVQQVLELARMHHIFEIIPRNSVLADGWPRADNLSKAAG
ncbi:MAG TPA: STAS domain-containing protein [Verrucomicrobiae bacterium]|jgi:anti-anti-sigma factor|nr:STAS domain-containing protein [Verrucomicrobiae bacterium]